MASEYFEKKKTFYGGRGLFASKPIPENTLVHTTLAPYAFVVYREYRKEVCAYCFAYAFESNKNAWNIRHEKEGSGVWFCSHECKEVWEREENVEGMAVQMNISIDQLDRRLKKGQSRAHPSPGPRDSEQTSSHPPSVKITQQFIDSAWKNAENRKTKLEEPLNDLELDLVRFLASGLIRRCAENLFSQKQQEYSNSEAAHGSRNDSQMPNRHYHPAGTWSEFLDLQNNEINYIQASPEVLDRQIRAYSFLRMAVIPALKTYVRTAEFVRSILGRDQGNAFGIFEMDGDDMVGYGIFVSGSYFNHDCSPNIRKKRSGRSIQFYTIKDVEEGQELCTNYVDVQDDVLQRRKNLSNWYFDCICQRCKVELSVNSIDKQM